MLAVKSILNSVNSVSAKSIGDLASMRPEWTIEWSKVVPDPLS